MFMTLKVNLLPAQDGPDKLNVSGYLQNMSTLWIQKGNPLWQSMNTTTNRLDFKWYMHEKITLSASARNIFSYGQMVYNYPVYKELLIRDEGYFDLTTDLFSDTSYILYTNIDRANILYMHENVEITAGRQRINWGINQAWNVNDIFNTFLLYDFDYIERPGCDAIRAVYYTGVTSSIQMAAKIDRQKKITAAGLVGFNNWDYDFQLIGGVMSDDIVVGAGWSGYVSNAGFTGEVSWFADGKKPFGDPGVLLFSSGANYTFSNSLYIHAAFLFNSDGTTGKAGRGSSIFGLSDLSPKTLTLARYSVYSQLSYPLTPLIRADVSSVVNPSDHSFYSGPGLTFSLSDNASLLLMSQIFTGESGTEFGDIGNLFFLRFKWSF